MSKTVLANVNGFTPCIDSIVKEHGIMTAAIFGVIWRYCQMKDNTCWASQETIGSVINVSRQTVCEHANKLVESGYLEIIDSLPGETVHYKDTGKASLSISLTGGVSEIDRGCKRNLQGGVKETDTKKEVKETNKDNTHTDVPPIQRMFEEITGLPVANANDVMALDELEKFKPTREDIQEAYNWFKAKSSKPLRYYSSLLEPIKYQVAKRLQKSVTLKSTQKKVLIDAYGNEVEL